MLPKSKLSNSTSMMRLGNSMPTLTFGQTHQSNRPDFVRLGLIERLKTKVVVEHEAAEVIRQKAKDDAEAEKYIYRQELQARVVIAGEHVARDAGLIRQTLTAESNEVTANAVTKMERERSARTVELFKLQAAKEESLRQSVLDGKMPEKYAQILADDYLESTFWLADGDKTQTRQLAESLRLFSLIPINFKGSASEGEDS